MKTKFLKLSLLAVVLFTVSCSDDDTKAIPPVVTKKFSNLAAPQTGGQGQAIGGEFTKFSFSESGRCMAYGGLGETRLLVSAAAAQSGFGVENIRHTARQWCVGA